MLTINFWLFVVCMGVMLFGDWLLYRSNRQTISQHLNAWGKAYPVIKALYWALAIFLFWHFFGA